MPTDERSGEYLRKKRATEEKIIYNIDIQDSI